MAPNAPRRTARRRAASLLAGLLIPLALASAGLQASRAAAVHRAGLQAASPYAGEEDHARFGVGWITGPITAYDLQGLGASWYLSWWTREEPARPGGVEFMQTIRLKEGTAYEAPGTVPDQPLTEERLRELVRANPGATWQIGNEPDSAYNDKTIPADYAVAYHDLYHIIKDEDPTALVANGGLVQATPLRMAYLDRIWEEYERIAGEPMPVDVWTIHGFILREQKGSWGAGIPPGMGDLQHLGELYELSDHDDLGILAEQIVRFRRWMADHDQRHKPLIVNEYGILMPEDIWPGFGDDVVIAFMEGTFDFFRTAADAEIGYPADGDRLVQRWAWYSLDDNIYSDGEVAGEMYNGDLFTGPVTKTMTAQGRAFGTYVVGDLALDSLSCTTSLLMEEGQTVTATVVLEVRKAGGLRPMDAVEVELRAEGTADGDVTRTWTLGPFDAATTTAHTLTATLPYTTPGAHPLVVEIDPADAIREMDERNNTATGMVLVATDRVFLPVVVHGR